MAQKTDIELTTDANVIKNETDAGENTATRVGTMLIDLIDSKVNNDDAGSGAVDSVNGQTGVVVLDAGDVGADPSGSAAAVASNLSAHIADSSDAHAGSAITNTPAGGISSTTVQSAINELDSEKQTASQVATAVAAVLATTITNGDTTHAPDGNSVFDALALKAAIAPRVQTVSSSATVTPDADANDAVVITAQAAALDIANPTGTPSQGQGLVIRIKDNGTARAITKGTLYRNVGATFPSTTTVSKTTYIALVYNSTDTKWDVIGTGTEDSAGGGGHTIQDEGTPLTQRTNLNFVGGGVTVTDDSGNDATKVTIPTIVNYWTTVPGTPTRVGNTSFTITDTSNANFYDSLLSRKTVLKWTDTAVVKMAMIVSATYATNTVTITIMGDTLASSATMSTFMYALEKSDKVTFAYAGVLAVRTDISRKFKADCQIKVFGADGYHGTAGTTNATTYDINKNGTTFMTTKVSIASAATVGNGFTADSGTELALNDIVSLDCDSVSTTQPLDAYIDLFIFPKQNIYLT